MPATSRGLLERDQLGMLGQVHAVVTGFGDPAPVHLVGAYAVLLVVVLVLGPVVRGRRAGGRTDETPLGRDSHPVPPVR